MFVVWFWYRLLRSESADEDVPNIQTAENREGSSGARHRSGCQGLQEHADTGSDDPADVEKSEPEKVQISFKAYVDRGSGRKKQAEVHA